jgi:hypothetical protein
MRLIGPSVKREVVDISVERSHDIFSGVEVDNNISKKNPPQRVVYIYK